MDIDTGAKKPSLLKRVRNLVIGAARNPHDREIFHNISLIAFFAWIGLGADGLSSSCYGPPEAFIALGQHHFLGIFVALATVVTILIISASYSQIIEQFPTGGGGYLVASKLLSPTTGMVAGCALLVDFVLTITLSIASGAQAIFSFLPPELGQYHLWFAVAGVMVLTILNMRGVKESVMPLIPVFLLFLGTHLFAIVYSFVSHGSAFPSLVSGTVSDIRTVSGSAGVMGLFALILRAYSMGAGTFTGIEAVSNGMSILREPKVQTGRRTMHYMSISLSVMVLGLTLAYMLYGVMPQPGRTLNAVLFGSISGHWNPSLSYAFILITLLAEAIILFVAAQTGFLGGPAILANMALDRWVPSQFAMLSDRLVTQNGILLMGIFALVLMMATGGSVEFLLVLYSINVFITFVLSQMGMVKHWWQSRGEIANWKKRITINGVGLALSAFILVSITISKFNEGGWITLAVTGAIVLVSVAIKRHYVKTAKLLRRLNGLVVAAGGGSADTITDLLPENIPAYDPRSKMAVVMVNGFNGLGLHTLFNIIRVFGSTFKNFIFVQVGVVDAGVFKGAAEIDRLKTHIHSEADRYVHYMQRQGFFAESISSIGTDVVSQISEIVPDIMKKYPNAVFFGGQLVFPENTLFSRYLHNYTVFSIQRRLYQQGIPVVILPIRVESRP